MRAVFGLVLLIGIALAGGAVYMAKQYMEQQAQQKVQVAPAVPTTTVFVAEKPLRYGEKLTKESVRPVKWPVDALPEGVFTKAEELFPQDGDKPRIVLRAMEKGEPILAVKVTKPGEDAGLTTRLDKGMRAFTIKVDVASGVSGFLRPGDRVDVYWTGSVRGAVEGATGEITRLIESGIELVAVDQMAGRDTAGATIARTVTVAVRPEQVAALALAQNTGRLTLALVGALDETVTQAAIEIDQRELLGIPDAAPIAPKKEEKRVCTIRTRKGADVVEIPIPCTN
ncbi:Flp pilus assembly protein CpaB [Jhaorihella thermophila]|uniref:Pilus assembly protein CpaB n=1 Tax=Jhaorihella thermophila TaxID=488547 RepID=A0A1H5XBI9_9RHOB|nr:Flp pilus assembly protein CpaB [Jhaorihella thermophila]SEG09134.1 pilus assembly protein CpaB [Jhaorihella thermophila]